MIHLPVPVSTCCCGALKDRNVFNTHQELLAFSRTSSGSYKLERTQNLEISLVMEHKGDGFDNRCR